MIKVTECLVEADGDEEEIATDLSQLLLVMRDKHPEAYTVALSVVFCAIGEDHKLRYEKE